MTDEKIPPKASTYDPSRRQPETTVRVECDNCGQLIDFKVVPGGSTLILRFPAVSECQKCHGESASPPPPPGPGAVVLSLDAARKKREPK